MRPTRNRFFCIAAKRTKMLFESESQANNFIKFNAGDMEELGGKVPVRSYYCPLCMGWHVTSNPNAEYFETHPSRAEMILNFVIHDKEIREENKEEAALKKGEMLIRQGQFADACVHYLTCYRSYNKKDISKTEKALVFLTKAFDAECLLVKQILDDNNNNDAEICKPAKRCLRQLKKASRYSGKDFGEYIDTLSSFCQSFPNVAKEKTQTRSEEEMMRSMEKKLDHIKMTLNRVQGNLASRQWNEAQRLINICTSDIKKLSGFSQCKEQLLEFIDSLMGYQKTLNDALCPVEN